MTIKSKDPFRLHQLLADLHEATAAQLSAITAIIEYQDERIKRIESLLSPGGMAN